jgi:hypothetical protein
MKRVFAVLLATACVLASTPGFARGGLGHGGGFANRGGFVRNPTTLLGSPTPQAPLAAPAQPPVINGPSARSPYGGVM